MVDRMAKDIFYKNFAASIALCAMLAVWLLKQPCQIAYFYINPNTYILKAIIKTLKEGAVNSVDK